MKKNKTFGYIISVLIAQTVGWVSALFTMPQVDTWYEVLDKPFFNPPSWVFGPVWTLLFTLMGIAAYRVWSLRSKPLAKTGLKIYGLQLLLNFTWSILFFGLQNPTAAFMEIVILLSAIVLNTILFSRVDKLAGWLFLPYVLWVGFATILNFTIVILN